MIKYIHSIPFINIFLTLDFLPHLFICFFSLFHISTFHNLHKFNFPLFHIITFFFPHAYGNEVGVTNLGLKHDWSSMRISLNQSALNKST